MLFVISIFHVAIGRVGTKIFPCFAFGLHHSAYLLACITAIPLVDDIQKRGEVIFLLIRAVYAVADSDKPHTLFREKNVRIKPVSYTHLDVYKRQAVGCPQVNSDYHCIHVSFSSILTAIRASLLHPSQITWSALKNASSASSFLWSSLSRNPLARCV